MILATAVKRRDISEVLHFTTHRGITGILAKQKILSRKRLPEDEYLEHVMLYNCHDRQRDSAWWDYINLSLSQVNDYLMAIAAGKWHVHRQGWWCIIALSPDILLHEGVYFATTNNAYPYVQRGTDLNAFEALFALSIRQFDNKVVYRSQAALPSYPTCPQAEVLYPKEMSLEHALHVYVPSDDVAAKYESISTVFPQKLCCKVNPDMFPKVAR